MHEPYDDEDDYDDDQYSNDYSNDQFKWYYKFDVGPNTPISNWLSDMFENMGTNWEFINIPDFPTKKFPVNSYFPNAGKGNSFQYLGNNYYKEAVWKTKYFIIDPIQSFYIDHIQQYSIYFLKQPNYYKGLFDIMN